MLLGKINYSRITVQIYYLLQRVPWYVLCLMVCRLPYAMVDISSYSLEMYTSFTHLWLCMEAERCSCTSKRALLSLTSAPLDHVEINKPGSAGGGELER